MTRPLGRLRAPFFIALAVSLLLTAGARAQGAVTQIGPVTPGHVPVWAADGRIMDSGSQPLTAASLGLPVYNVIAYGAKCDATGGIGTDDTLAINAAAAALRAHGFGLLYGPPDRYCYHTGTINLTNFNPATGGGAATKKNTKISIHLMCAVTGGVCADGIGSKYAVWNDFEVRTPNALACDSGDDAAVGLQIGRPNPTQTASQQDFFSPHFEGCWSQAAIINYAAEDVAVFGGEIDNQSFTAGSNNVRVDCDNHFNLLASSFVTIAWPSGTFASCNAMTFHNTNSQKGVRNLVASSATGKTITFPAVVASIAAGQIVTNGPGGHLPNGSRVVFVTPTTVVLNVDVSNVVNGDTISFAAPSPAVWMDGTAGFAWNGHGYISCGCEFPIVMYEEAGQPDIYPDFSVHIESANNITSDILVSGTVATPTIKGLTRFDYFDEAAFSLVMPDFASGVQAVFLPQAFINFNPQGSVASTMTDWGKYQNVASAVVASGGSGCSNGAQTFTLVGGNGFPIATVNGTVSGGALSGALTVPQAGAYQATPGTTPTTTGGSCSVQPTITPTYGASNLSIPIQQVGGIETTPTSTNVSTPGSTLGLPGADGGVVRLKGPHVQIPQILTATTAGQSPVCRGGNGTTTELSLCANYNSTTKTTSYQLTTADSGSYLDNTGASGEVDYTLPAWSIGLHFCFTVTAAQIVKVVAPASTSIAIGASNSAAAGNITANAPYATACVYATSVTNQWAADRATGTWTVN